MKFKKLIFVLIIILTMTFITGCAKTNEDYAIDNTKNAITSVLKAPATAQFPSDDEFTVTEVSNGRYKVKGYVDSENGFGAMIRTHYVIELQIAEDMYAITDLEILE